MPTFAANLTFLFHELPFLDRFQAARETGFRYVEHAFPYDTAPEEIQKRLKQTGLNMVLINLPPGNLTVGELGLAADPDRMDEFRRGVEQALEYARLLGVSRLNCLAGRRREEVPLADQFRVLVENMRYAAGRMAAHGLLMTTEPLNTYDVPGFLLSTSTAALGLMDEVGALNLKLQYDLYHMQKMEGNLTETLRRHISRIGHIQMADNPGRLPPGAGEINFPFLLGEIDRIGYQGYVGVEYFALPDTRSSLAWIKNWGFSL
ncbi:MAG: TIM barrel protein [Thermodesulfobacteriota bacterium]